MPSKNENDKISASNQLAIDIAKKCGIPDKKLISLDLHFEATQLPTLNAKYYITEKNEADIYELLANYEIEVKKIND